MQIKIITNNYLTDLESFINKELRILEDYGYTPVSVDIKINNLEYIGIITYK